MHTPKEITWARFTMAQVISALISLCKQSWIRIYKKGLDYVLISKARAQVAANGRM